MGAESFALDRPVVHPPNPHAPRRGDALPVRTVGRAAGDEPGRRPLARVVQRSGDGDFGRARVGDAREAGVVRGESRVDRGDCAVAHARVLVDGVRSQRRVGRFAAAARDLAAILGSVGHGGVAGRQSAQPARPTGVLRLPADVAGAEGVGSRRD